MLWKADEPLSDEWLLVRKHDIPGDLTHVGLSQAGVDAAKCSSCGRFWIPEEVEIDALVALAPEEGWIREGRMPTPADMGAVGWGNYLVAQVAQALVGEIGHDIVAVAVEWAQPAVRLHIALDRLDHAARENLDEIAAELDVVLGGNVPIEVEPHEGQTDTSWSGYRHRRVFGRK
ncbi:MAG: hypothetical protein GY745_14225 [Actinomycetia bacterium]|nr:hypothetical protein [Actinomycetes bacterium]